jgi:MFS superfamily sulfate permease-like transporter
MPTGRSHRTLTPHGLRLLRGYRRNWLRPDALAGVTVAAYLIPQVMAYADVAGVPPVVGLWTIVGSLLVYTVFGSSRQLSVGPESTTALMTAVTIAPLAAGALLPKLPVPLVAVLLATAVAAVFSLRDHGIQVIGAIPAGVPSPGLPAVSGADVATLLLPAVGVAVVGYSDNVLTARSFATRNSYRVDANSELLALGTANVTAGMLQGFPVSSSASRTAIGDSLGSRSQVHSLVAVAVVVVVLLFGRPLLASFPAAALGALVIYAALRLIEISEFRRIGAFRRSELALALATTAGVLLLDVLYGVLVAIALSILDLLRRIARPHDGILGAVPGVAGMHDVDDYPDATRIPGLVVYRYDAPLCFANADDFRRRAMAAVDNSPTPVAWFLLNAEANVEVDITAVDALEDLRTELARRDIVFAMARVKQDLRTQLAAAGLVERVGEDHIFPTLPTAVAAFHQRVTGEGQETQR